MKLRSHIGENALFLRDELERNFACVQAGDYQERRENIEAMANVIPKRIELAMLEQAREHPDTETWLRFNERDTGLVFAGAGSESTAVTDGEKVWKIHRKSVHWAEKDRKEKAYQDREDHVVLARHMGEFMVRELTTVEDHPLRKRKRAVVTQQEYLNFVPTGIFSAYEPTINEWAVEDLDDVHPGVTQPLGRLATQGLEMYEETGLLIDSSGFNNIVMAERDGEMKLTCLDGTPVKQNHASVAERIVGQLTALRDYVA